MKLNIIDALTFFDSTKNANERAFVIREDLKALKQRSKTAIQNIQKRNQLTQCVKDNQMRMNDLFFEANCNLEVGCKYIKINNLRLANRYLAVAETQVEILYRSIDNLRISAKEIQDKTQKTSSYKEDENEILAVNG